MVKNVIFSQGLEFIIIITRTMARKKRGKKRRMEVGKSRAGSKAPPS